MRIHTSSSAPTPRLHLSCSGCSCLQSSLSALASCLQTHPSTQGAASQHAQPFPSTRGHRLLQAPPSCPACPGRSQAADARPRLQTFLPSAGGKATAPRPALRMHSLSCAHQALALGMSKETLGVQEIVCFLEDVAPGLNFGS